MKHKKREREHSDEKFNERRIAKREEGKALRAVGVEEEHHGRKFSNKTGVPQVKRQDIQNSQDLQMQMYLRGDLKEMEKCFELGVCFGQKVQRQITLDDNAEVLKLFLKYWEFIPTERLFLIKHHNLEMLGTYMDNRSLGSQSEDLARDGSYSRSFIERYSGSFNKKAKAIVRSLRQISI